jgi:hypothetical protein
MGSDFEKLTVDEKGVCQYKSESSFSDV